MDTKNGAALLPMAKARGLRAVQVVISPVADNGLVQGKVKCTEKGCPFEDAVRLVGWKPVKDEETPR